jgi:hypothetical protein
MRFREFRRGLTEAGLDVDPHGLPQNYFGPSQDYPVPKPLPDVPVDLPDQYRADRNVLVYDGQVFNAMTPAIYQAMQTSRAGFDSEVIPAGKIPGVAGKILITQAIDRKNYFLTDPMARTLQRELNIADLADRNRSVQSRMARGEKLSAMPTGEIDGTKPTAGTTDAGTAQRPIFPWQRPVRKI